MRKNIEKVKKVKFCHAKGMRLFVVMAFIFFQGCSSNEEEVTNTAITESQDPEVNAPLIQTPAPLIHLADNLDEQDRLGWCIDTRGNGFNENLHTHSCKASGGDVQFIYNEETLQICSVEFTGYCVEMSGGPIEGMSLSLVESNTDSPDQRFVYNESSGEFNPEEDTSLCIAAGNTSAVAGIYMSRSLTLEISSETEESLKKWIIVSN